MSDRHLDMTESAANAILGLAISVATVHAVWPLMGWSVTPAQSLGVSLLFFTLSIARAYVLRRLFRRFS